VTCVTDAATRKNAKIGTFLESVPLQP